MKYFFSILISIFISANLFGQNSDIVTQLSVPDSSNGATINIHSDTKSQFVINPDEHEIRGYRVRIFFDNGQNARSEAEQIIGEFSKKHPSIGANMDYTAPYFRVTVGKFLTKEEAVMLWGKILSAYSKAFVINEPIKLSSFGTEAIYQSSEEVSGEFFKNTVKPEEEAQSTGE